MSKINNQLKSMSLSQKSYPILPKLDQDPFNLFESWFQDAIVQETEANAVVLSTVNANGVDARVVLLKAIERYALFFETRTDRNKVKQIDINNNVTITLYWPVAGRQIRIQGTAKVTKGYPKTLDSNFRDDLTAYKITPTVFEFYQSLTEGGFKRFKYALSNDWILEEIN